MLLKKILLISTEVIEKLLKRGTASCEWHSSLSHRPTLFPLLPSHPQTAGPGAAVLMPRGLRGWRVAWLVTAAQVREEG